MGDLSDQVERDRRKLEEESWHAAQKKGKSRRQHLREVARAKNPSAPSRIERELNGRR